MQAGARHSLLLILRCKLVGHVVLVDIAHVVHRLLAHILRNLQFHIPEPLVWIQPIRLRLLAQPNNAVRSRVVARKDEQRLIHWIDRRIIEVRIGDVPHHLHARVDIRVRVVYVRHIDRMSCRQLRHYLHDSHGTHPALPALIQQRFLVSLRRKHQVVEIVLGRVLLEVLHVLVELLNLRGRCRILDPLRILKVAAQQCVSKRRADRVRLRKLINQRLKLRIVLAYYPADVLAARHYKVSLRLKIRKNLRPQVSALFRRDRCRNQIGVHHLDQIIVEQFFIGRLDIKRRLPSFFSDRR